MESEHAALLGTKPDLFFRKYQVSHEEQVRSSHITGPMLLSASHFFKFSHLKTHYFRAAFHLYLT